VTILSVPLIAALPSHIFHSKNSASEDCPINVTVSHCFTTLGVITMLTDSVDVTSKGTSAVLTFPYTLATTRDTL
jgi:hypothetical protein